MGKYFGTDGFRGEAGITLTADHAYKVGRFLGWYYNALRERNGNNEPARIVIGKDTRRSSYMYENALAAGIVSSGADASLGLAALSAGSQEAFVERMNEKAAELGLSDGAHFTNCVGLYDPEHRCTARDMALILGAAMENKVCREILTTKHYHTAATEFHPEGQSRLL